MKKILLSCACCLLAVGLLAGCDTEEEVVTPNEPDTTVPSTGGDDGGSGGESGETVYKLGALDTTTYEYVYFSGEASGNFLGVTSSWDEAAPVTFEEVTIEEEGVIAVSISFVDAEGATKYISWSDSTKVDIADEPYAWYWVEENTVFATGLSEGRALVYYAGDPSFRAYAQNTSNLANPHVRVYTTEPEAPEAPEPIEPVLGTVTEGEYFLGVTLGGVPYYFDGQVYSNYYAEVTSDGWDAVVVTVAAVTGGYTLSFVEEGVTQYLNMTENNSNRNLKWGTEPFVWSYDSTYSVFVAQDSEGEWYFIGTYGSYVELALNAYGYLTGDKSSSYTQYPSELFTVITYNAPESVTISGAEESQSLEEGETLQLSATVTGGDEPLNGKIIWESSNEETATVVDGLVTAVSANETAVTISATSAVNSSATDSVSITITERTAPGPIVATDWQDTYSGATFKLGCTYDSGAIGYIDGCIEGTYTKEGTFALNWDTGVDVTVASATNDNEYYLTFEKDSETNYITITSSGELLYTATAGSLYWDETAGVWTESSSKQYFLSLNSTYDCLYASSYTSVASYTAAYLYEWFGEQSTDEHEQITDTMVISQLGVEAQADITGKSTTHTACTIDWTGGDSGIKPWGSSPSSSGYRSTIRVYNGSSFTITANEGYTLTKVVFESGISATVGTINNNGNGHQTYEGGVAGDVTVQKYEDICEVVMNSDASSLKVTQSSNTWYLAYITVYYTTAA